ncbi:MAG: hypothetical protein ACPGUD_01865 [Parashewanella sp.]
MSKSAKGALALTLGSVLLSPLALAQHDFSFKQLNFGYQPIKFKKSADESTCDTKTKHGGKCGEGKCGKMKAGEAKCGEGKCGGKKAHEGNCGGAMAQEGKCGEGKCGGKKLHKNKNTL